MPRYYFDIKDGDHLVADEEGLELRDVTAAEVEAAYSLAGLAKDHIQSFNEQRLSIEVRSTDGPVFRVTFLFEMTARKQ